MSRSVFFKRPVPRHNQTSNLALPGALTPAAGGTGAATSAGGAFQQMGNIAGDAVTTLAGKKDYGYGASAPTMGASIGSAALKGAGTGAMIGSAIPGIGTAVGAAVGGVVGGVGGYIAGNKAQKAALAAKNKFVVGAKNNFAQQSAISQNGQASFGSSLYARQGAKFGMGCSTCGKKHITRFALGGETDGVGGLKAPQPAGTPPPQGGYLPQTTNTASAFQAGNGLKQADAPHPSVDQRDFFESIKRKHAMLNASAAGPGLTEEAYTSWMGSNLPGVQLDYSEYLSKQGAHQQSVQDAERLRQNSQQVLQETGRIGGDRNANPNLNIRPANPNGIGISMRRQGGALYRRQGGTFFFADGGKYKKAMLTLTPVQLATMDAEYQQAAQAGMSKYRSSITGLEYAVKPQGTYSRPEETWKAQAAHDPETYAPYNPTALQTGLQLQSQPRPATAPRKAMAKGEKRALPGKAPQRAPQRAPQPAPEPAPGKHLDYIQQTLDAPSIPAADPYGLIHKDDVEPARNILGKVIPQSAPGTVHASYTQEHGSIGGRETQQDWGRQYLPKGKSEKETVRLHQQWLQQLGYDIGSKGADGYWGKDTQSAFEQYRAQNKAGSSKNAMAQLARDYSKTRVSRNQHGGVIQYAEGGAVILGGQRHGEGQGELGEGNPVVDEQGEKVAETEREELLLTIAQTEQVEALVGQYDKSKDPALLSQLGALVRGIIVNDTEDKSGSYNLD